MSKPKRRSVIAAQEGSFGFRICYFVSKPEPAKGDPCRKSSQNLTFLTHWKI